MKLDANRRQISIEKAVELAERLAKQLELNKQSRRLLIAYVESMPAPRGYVRLDKFHSILANFRDAVRHGDPALLFEKRGFKFKRIPDVIEVVESKEYANQRRTAWKSTKDSLWKIWHSDPPPSKVVLTGAAGTGKSEVAWLSAFYSRLLLACLWNPHLEYGIGMGSWIVFGLQSRKAETAHDSLFSKLQFAIDESPWFNKHCPRNKDINKELIFPDRIKVMNLTGNFKAALGKDMFFFVLNEADRMDVIQESKQMAHSSKKELDVAHEMFVAAENRLDSRFGQYGGGYPGRMIVDSQRNYVGDFSGRLIEQAKTDPTILVIQRSLWEAQAHKYPPTEPKFLVELGDEHRPPRIIERREDAINEVIEVPERHRPAFESDCEEATKNLAGIPSTSTGRFLPFPEKITLAREKYVERTGGSSLFLLVEISLRELFGDAQTTESDDWS